MARFGGSKVLWLQKIFRKFFQKLLTRRNASVRIPFRLSPAAAHRPLIPDFSLPCLRTSIFNPAYRFAFPPLHRGRLAMRSIASCRAVIVPPRSGRKWRRALRICFRQRMENRRRLGSKSSSKVLFPISSPLSRRFDSGLFVGRDEAAKRDGSVV